MNALLSWQLIYHLSGLTLLGITEQEPLGTLPVAIRTAVLKTIKQIQPDAIELILNQKSPLNYTDAQYNYEYVNSWSYQNYSYSANIAKLLEEFPERFPTYQKVALRLLLQTYQKQSRLVVVDYQPSVAAFAVALIDAVALVERVSELYNLNINLPEIDIYFVGQTDAEGVMRLLHHYRGVDFEAPTNFVDFAKIPIRLHKTANLPDKVDFISAAESLTSNLPRNACIFRDLEDFAAGFVAIISSIPPINQNPVSFQRPTLDYFARRYFSVPELKLEQVKLIQKALSQESSLGLLPTGFGKSLIFQLYSLLIPRAILVISPLRALIRDQVYNLQRLGLTCVESIVFGDTEAQRRKKLKDFKSGRYRLLYISPERLQTKEFYDELKTTMQQAPVGALIIDEAHCVSEWGHDFRPAYLQIGRLQQVLEEVSGTVVPIIALTATASPQVREDIIRVLNLKTENIQQGNSDRPELSLSVHVVEEPEQKPLYLTRLVQEIIPQVLNIPTKDIISNQSSSRFTNASTLR